MPCNDEWVVFEANASIIKDDAVFTAPELVDVMTKIRDNAQALLDCAEASFDDGSEAVAYAMSIHSTAEACLGDAILNRDDPGQLDEDPRIAGGGGLMAVLAANMDSARTKGGSFA